MYSSSRLATSPGSWRGRASPPSAPMPTMSSLAVVLIAALLGRPCRAATTITSERSCDELSATSGFSDNLGDDDICGASPAPCAADATFRAALGICAQPGARLCTLSEVERNEASGTGCGFDSSRVWTQTRGSCPQGQMMSAAGSSANSGPIASECTAIGTALAVRCCGDAVPVAAAPTASMMACAELGWAQPTDPAAAAFCMYSVSRLSACETCANHGLSSNKMALITSDCGTM